MPNPYDPQTPARPEYFGGREQVLQVVQERIRLARDSRRGGGVLIYGHRGVGKTSLLKKITSIAERKSESPTNALVFYRRLGRTTTDTELYALLNEELREQITQRRSLIETVRAAAKAVESIQAFEIGIDLQKNAAERTPYQLWKQSIRTLRNVDYVLVAIDDADFLSIEAIGELKTIVEDTQDTPVLLVVSGGIKFEEKLVDEYSPIASIFSGASFNVGKFELKETTEVLRKPLADERTTWQDDAITELHKLTMGYPFLVQCLAQATYIEHEALSKDFVRDAVPASLRIGRSWLDHEIPGASDEDVQSFVKISGIGKDVLQSVEMSRAGVQSPYIGRLVRLGGFKKISRGRYQLIKSPMIATYEALKRGLF